MTRTVKFGLACLVGMLALGFTLSVAAASFTQQLSANDTIRIVGNQCDLRVTQQGARDWTVSCVGAAPTATPRPTATPVPPQGGGQGSCGESMNTWHPPVVNGCATGHEHGDAPPSWVSASGYPLSFHGAFNTSPAENTAKHAAMKGFATRFNNQDVYFRIHAASNPLDRSARYHSYELWIRDEAGAVSHMQGWYNTGDPRPASQGGARFATTARGRGVAAADHADPGRNLAAARHQLRAMVRCSGRAVWGPDFGWTICNATTLYRANENATADDQGTWVRYRNGELGTTRRLELAWYANRSNLRGTVRDGPVRRAGQQLCGGREVVKFGDEYSTVCLEQIHRPDAANDPVPRTTLSKELPGRRCAAAELERSTEQSHHRGTEGIEVSNKLLCPAVPLW